MFFVRISRFFLRIEMFCSPWTIINNNFKGEIVFRFLDEFPLDRIMNSGVQELSMAFFYMGKVENVKKKTGTYQ